MKDSKRVILAAFAGFLCVLIGIFLGRNTTDNRITLPEATKPATSLQELASSESTKIESDTFGKININTASHSLLMQLPGIGDTYAQRLIDYREANGPFTKPSDIQNVEGIGEKRFSQLEDYITTGG